MKLTEDTKAWHSKLCDMSEHEIVELMREEQIKGVPMNATSCAVTRLIRQKTGQYVVTTATALREPMGGAEDPENLDHVVHSDGLKKFIANFDTYGYPELVL